MDAILRPMRLSGNVLKIIAAFFMVIDHIGYILFPACTILRIIGRASFPIFAFMIAEGCCYTKNKRNYFLGIFILATLCQIFYYAYEGSTYMGILVTFSLSILLIYLLQFAKEKLFLSGGTHWGKIGAVCMFLLAVAAVYELNRRVPVDYGFWGCMAPVFACVWKKTEGNFPTLFEKLDILPVHIGMFGLGLLLLSAASGGIQFYCLLALPLLCAYSGKRGKAKLKLFFYIFYPAHLLVLQLIGMLWI